MAVDINAPAVLETPGGRTPGGSQMPTQTVLDRFMSKVVWNGDPDECWTWAASLTTTTYGQFSLEGRPTLAHRLSYEFFVGPIPEGLVIDHLCRNTTCINPAHLEPVPQTINILRGVNPAVTRAANNEIVDASSEAFQSDAGARENYERAGHDLADAPEKPVDDNTGD